jgi:pimeloyl-ACP methyl ester carboxylesterase
VLIYYTSFGQGPPLLIVHGGPGASHDYFLPYLLPLARHNRLIFIDERGSGKSQKLDDPAGLHGGEHGGRRGGGAPRAKPRQDLR